MPSKIPPPGTVTIQVSPEDVAAVDAYRERQAVPPARAAVVGAAFRRGMIVLAEEAQADAAKRAKGRRS